MTEHRFCIYRLDTASHRVAAEAPAGYSVRVWRPTWSRVPPRGLRMSTQWVWWVFHNFRVFRSRDFHVIFLERDGRLVHRTSVFPPFFRFPFMAPRDLQIGDTWTDEEYRGRGLAGFAVRAVVSLSAMPGRRYWYVVDQGNHASIRVIEKEGFVRVGRGARVARFGLRLLGHYAMTADV